MELIILASGRGSRLKKFTKIKPKIFLQVYKNLTIFDLISRIFSFFNKVTLVAGYKHQYVEKKIKNFKIKIIKNIKYKNTNMVESLFLARKSITQDVVVIYGDIFFDLNIIKKLIKQKKSTLPLYSKWLSLWKKRMKLKKIKFDAENLEVSKDNILTIGGKIKKNYPKLQYMGIMKFKKKDYFNLMQFYKRLNNKKIDLTRFLNLAIKNKIVKLYYFRTNKLWLEFDNSNDYYLSKKILRNELS